jgi:phenylacetate-CoA ligase
MSQDRPYWNMEIEPKLNTPEMRELQELKLKNRIKLLRQRAPYYTKLFRQSGVHEDKIKSFEEFRRAIPIFTKSDWQKLVQANGGNLLEAMNQIIPVNAYEDLYLISTTSGTTGEPEPYPFTQKDAWDVYGEVLARYAWRAGVRSQDRLLHCFALSMVIVGIPSLIGNFKIGCLVIPVGAEVGTERILKTARYFRPTVIMGTPSLALYLIEKAPEVIGMKVGELGIRVFMSGREPGAGLPEVRRRIESAYGCKLFDVGADLGISCGHEEYQGMHYVGDDFMILELVDPETKKPLPFENGQKGEAVFTNVAGDAFGWAARRSLGDIMQIFTEPCLCGLSGFRYKVMGRVDDMLKVKGVMVYPIKIKKLIEGFVPRVTGQFRIVLDGPPPRVEPPLKLKLECGEDIPEDKLHALASEIAEAMSKDIKTHPKIIWVEPHELERSTYKDKVFEKTYEK